MRAEAPGLGADLDDIDERRSVRCRTVEEFSRCLRSGAHSRALDIADHAAGPGELVEAGLALRAPGGNRSRRRTRGTGGRLHVAYGAAAPRTLHPRSPTAVERL